MAKHTDRVRIEEVDWLAVFPWLRLLGAFRMAVHPVKLLTALALVVFLYLAGVGLDLLLPRDVHSGELDQYRQVYFGLQTREQFEAWRKSQEQSRLDTLRKILTETPGIRGQGFTGDIEAIVTGPNPIGEAHRQLHAHYVMLCGDYETARPDPAVIAYGLAQRRRALDAVRSLEPRGAFDASLKATLDAIDRLARAAATLNLGWSQTVGVRSSVSEPEFIPEADGIVPLPGAGSAIGYHDQTTVFAALRDLVLVIPAWLWNHHRLFFLLYVVIAAVAFAFLGGAVARMAAVQATRDDRIGIGDAMRYVRRRWWSFLLTPLVPIGIIALAALLMAVLGLLFNVPGIDILGAVLFVVILLAGFLVAGTLLLSLAGIHLAYPATAIDGSDVFDAISRAFNYVLNRPLRWLFYSLVTLVHGAITYLLFSLVLFITIWAVQKGASAWVMTETDLGVNRFDAILPPPAFGQLAYDIDYASLDGSAKVAAFIVRCWMFLVIGLLGAFAISFYHCANSWIYLLLRRSADGVELEDVVVDPPGDAEQKVEENAPSEAEAETED